MSFDIGPWTCFGAVLLQKLTHIINNHQEIIQLLNGFLVQISQ
uniref:Cytochrome P450 n=1 Tax=Heterorhabditis bacteriophora TaxID=37862 RepID=A0A1I7WYP5_HETBA